MQFDSNILKEQIEEIIQSAGVLQGDFTNITKQHDAVGDDKWFRSFFMF